MKEKGEVAMHIMPLKVEKFFSSAHVRMMRWDEKGVYLLLLAEAWLAGGRLPPDRGAIRELLQIAEDAVWERIDRKVLAMFSMTDDGQNLENKTLSQVFSDTMARTRKMSESGVKGNMKRWKSGGDMSQVSGGDGVAMELLSPPDRNKSKSKSNINTLLIPFSSSLPIPGNLDSPEFRKAWDEWMKFRRTKTKVKDWNLLFGKQLEWMSQMGPELAIEAMDNSMRNGYQGLFEVKRLASGFKKEDPYAH